jgi:uncharacterized protein (DUF697 family)
MKKLPKVIRRDLRPSAKRAGTPDGQTPTTPEEPTSANDEPAENSTERAKGSTEPAKASTRRTEASMQRTEASTERTADSTGQADTPAETSTVAAVPPTLPQPRSNDDFSKRRRTLAYKMVERYSVFAGGAGIIPMPIVSLGGVMGVNIRMVQILCKMYGVPFQRDRARAIVVGLVGGATPVGIAAATASTLAYFTPATNLIAVAVSSAMAITCTRRIGRVFVDRFEAGRGIN